MKRDNYINNIIRNKFIIIPHMLVDLKNSEVKKILPVM